MKKIKFIAAVLFLAVGFISCQSNKILLNSEVAEGYIPEDLPPEQYYKKLVSMDVTSREKRLGVTKELRKTCVDKYGIEKYRIALNCVPYFVLYQNRSTRIVLDSDLDMYKDYSTIETVEIVSSMQDKHIIPADYVTNGDYNRDTVILVHGAGENRRKLFWRVKMFLELGYNVFQYDQRQCGDNEARYVTCGALEQYDLLDCAKYVKERTGGKVKIAAYGSSLGGATVIQAISNPEIAGYFSSAIIDCPATGIRSIVEKPVKANCPAEYQDLAIPAIYGFMSTVYDIPENRLESDNLAKAVSVPVLMIISEADEILDYKTQQDFFEKITYSKKYLFKVRDSDHCCVAANHEAEYADFTKKALTGELFN